MTDAVTSQAGSFDRVMVGGHSLGAAVASLAAVWLASSVTAEPVFVYTFGKPRVGNLAYADCVRTHFPGRFWRMENEDDLIPDVPLSVTLNTTDPQSPYIYQHEGLARIYSINWESLELNHSVNNYFEGLEISQDCSSSSLIP
jgi:predicted lipase